MRIVYSINDGSDGKWCILRDQVLLHDRLPFGRAITVARENARDEYARTGLTETVEIIPVGTAPVELARFSRPNGHA